jgi:YaaC-like Protein
MAGIQNNSEIRFLESVENLKKVIHTAVGRTINTEHALQISACLQQGRLFFEAAATTAEEIRPLLLSYGTIAFAKAVVAARCITKLESLPQSHGLRDISAGNASMKDLRLRVEGTGIFHHSVDAARAVERVSIVDNARTVWFSTPSCASGELADAELTLEDILARVGALATLYRDTFSREPGSLSATVERHPGAPLVYTLETSAKAPSAPTARDLLNMVRDLRQRFPFLARLSFSYARYVWDYTTMTFDASRPGGDLPADEAGIRVTDDGSQVTYQPQPERAGWQAIPLEELYGEILPCSQGGLFGFHPTFASPVRDSVYLSEFSLLYLGTYLLGSLVRYRPEIWIHALYGTETPTRPRDDGARALIQSFLDTAAKTVPLWCVAAIRAETLE